MAEIHFAEVGPELGQEPTLVEVLDRLLDRGVVLRGEVWLTVADVDLAFIGLDLLLASPDTMRRTSRGQIATKT